jgi:lysozyme
VGIWTIGYGSTDRRACRGMTITRDQAVLRLYHDVDDAEATDQQPRHGATHRNPNSMPSSAWFLTSAAVHFASPPCYRKLNAGDYAGASNEFMRWIKGGKTLPGTRWLSHPSRR